MEIINILNKKIEKLVHEYELIKKENELLKRDLDDLKNKNDALERNNQDMLLKIDSTLTFVEAKSGGK
ncbi:hypothetical protein CP965_00345 [Halarcobacter mediterraneus]|uniref:Cell division protein ZapB n=1 Tax=Halarcobacter mediterraneus TaxID=2023153 RepID=A0A4Q1B0U9_9BACT|nr:hypothetical protein [Halarcobacter mediterraneus]RXK13931.1 hypothetical protein CP965_00345 [Halarcobacter mediterraneus]